MNGKWFGDILYFMCNMLRGSFGGIMTTIYYIWYSYEKKKRNPSEGWWSRSRRRRRSIVSGSVMFVSVLAGCKQSRNNIFPKMIRSFGGSLYCISKCILCNPKLIAPTWSFVFCVLSLSLRMHILWQMEKIYQKRS